METGVRGEFIMKSRKILVLTALLIGQFFALNANAQNLYISNIDVRARGVGDIAGGSGYCDDEHEASVAFSTAGGNVWANSSLIEFERPRTLYPGACLGMCVKMMCVNPEATGEFGIDELVFEVFKFGSGANPLDPASTPPIKTISMYNIGKCLSINSSTYTIVNSSTGQTSFCAAWDGSYNLNGIFGKTNGQFGFRARVKTNQVSDVAGNINIEQTAAFPGQNQIPIQINVTNIHTVRSSPTVVGRITGVAAQPYNILYRLSKDAVTSITVYDANTQGSLPLVRNIIADVPRTGEGTPDGTLTNGDFWDGRDNGGNFVAGGNYLARIDAWSNDRTDWPTDLAWPATVQVSLDPLQITDVAIKPLGASSTDTALISYMLTEAATVYVDIYTPATVISPNGSPPTITPGSGTLIKRFMEQKDRRMTVSNIWDGRDSNGSPVCDGDYMYAIYAVMPSSSVFAPGGQVWTMRTMVGTIPVQRGRVVAFISPSSTVLGSSPSVAGLDPFYFRYTPVRDAYVSLNILDMDGQTIRRRVTTNETRFANFSNREVWDGRDDNGAYVSSGTYLAELITTDPYQCSALKVSTITALIPVHMFRIVDVKTYPLLGGSSDTARISFELSQSLFVELHVYDKDVVINPAQWPWLSPAPGTPVYSTTGMRPGRFNITEYWDGRDKDGQLLPDGSYPFTLIAYTTGTAQNMYATDKVYGAINIARGQIIFTLFEVIPSIPTMYNSSDTVKLPPYEIDYVVTRQSSVTVQILNLAGVQMANVNGRDTTRDGGTLYKDFWDGKTDLGGYVPSGQYTVRVTAQDISTRLTGRATVQQIIDVNPMRIYDVAITPLTLGQPAMISYQVSEPMKVATKIYYPGTTFTSDGKAYPLEPGSVVKRIIGIRPARTQITEYWDGTDVTLSKVPDGNYVFKLYGSTDTSAISTLDGSYAAGAALADDIVTANIPLTKDGTSDLCGDFNSGTFFAPNPYVGTSGWFRMPVVINGRLILKIYNLTGDLIYKHDFGIRGAGDDPKGVKHDWPKVNSSGKTVAGGVYFAAIRFEATEGTRDVCQVVKKILIP